MKYKVSFIICAAVVVILAVSYFFSPMVETSDIEMRNMSTFNMIFDPVDEIDPDTGEKSIIYNADKSIPDRLEMALKDQIFIRDFVVLNYSDLEAKLVELKKDLFFLRMQHATNQLDNPVKISLVKKDIARVQTIIREKQLEQ